LPDSRISSALRRCSLVAALAVFSLILCSLAFAQKGPVQRAVQGKVLGSHSEPLSSAIVYLKNLKTNDIKSFIATQDGSYRFGQISPDIDYQVWAQFKDTKSGSKTVSSFDSRKVVTIDFHIKTDK
jgi:hypothetical protein